MHNCEKNSFYDFCTKKIQDECYLYLYEKFILIQDSIKDKIQKEISEWRRLLQSLNEKNYIYVADKINIQDKEIKNEADYIIFYYYKTMIKSKLGIEINQQTTFEEVYSYLYLIKNSSKEIQSL